MANNDYWLLSLEYALDEADAFGALSKEQMESVAASLSVSAENEGMATGRDHIPSSAKAERASLREGHASEVRRLEGVIGALEAALARNLRVEQRRIVVNNGEVELLRQ